MSDLDAWLAGLAPNNPPPAPSKKRRRQNSRARATMLVERRSRQELREYGVWNDGRFTAIARPVLRPAWRNRRTGKPHEHARAKARRLRQVERAGT